MGYKKRKIKPRNAPEKAKYLQGLDPGHWCGGGLQRGFPAGPRRGHHPAHLGLPLHHRHPTLWHRPPPDDPPSLHSLVIRILREKEDKLQRVQGLEQMQTELIIDKLAKKYMKSSDSSDIKMKSTNLLTDSTGSTPDDMYNFLEDSPNSCSTKNTKTVGKTSGVRLTKSKTVKYDKVTKVVKRNSKVIHVHKNDDPALVTPVTRSRKIVMTRATNINKPKKFIKPIAQPNLDDISPILRNSASRKNVTRQVERTDISNKQRRRSSRKVRPGLETPAVSFIEADSCGQDNDDSAIFVSPQKQMRFSSGKTSTPAERRRISSRIKHAKSAVIPPAKVTSTPFTQTKPKQGSKQSGKKLDTSPGNGPLEAVGPGLSPVERAETPTSDYESMYVVGTPSAHTPGPDTWNGKPFTPAFTLDVDTDIPCLNRSTSSTFKKSKKKLSKSNYTASMVDEWAEKVNSELEDIENFELSVEG